MRDSASFALAQFDERRLTVKMYSQDGGERLDGGDYQYVAINLSLSLASRCSAR